MLGSVTIHRLLGKMAEVEASDLHIKIGSPPVLRIHSHLHRVESGDLTADDTSKLLSPIIPAHLKPQLEEKGGVDFSHMEGPSERFSCSRRPVWCIGLTEIDSITAETVTETCF